MDIETSWRVCFSLFFSAFESSIQNLGESLFACYLATAVTETVPVLAGRVDAFLLHFPYCPDSVCGEKTTPVHILFITFMSECKFYCLSVSCGRYLVLCVKNSNLRMRREFVRKLYFCLYHLYFHLFHLRDQLPSFAWIKGNWVDAWRALELLHEQGRVPVIGVRILTCCAECECV